MIAPLPPGVPAAAVVPPRRRPYAAVFRALLCAAAVTGIVIDMTVGDPLQVPIYFTIQSNALLALALGWSAHRAWTGRPPLSPRITGGTFLFIAITGLVYHLILANDSSGFSMTGDALSGWRALSNQLLHTVTPIGAALDWFLLTAPGGLLFRYAAQWLLYPAAYFAFALIRGALLSPDAAARYPYPFLDVTAHGYAGIAMNALVLGLAFYALAIGLVALDRVRPDLRRHGNRISPERAGGLK
ncbi:Pr6Pr family membrane protein [Streptomyces sp. NBC_00237]|uniref:Pr6Pr family membrane protein n=1 Tax=Streptomyces sp. NBC_00237 TaxID=2975687 RepID=UPI00225BF934|nr:Pr6Pr family membrane protein [Streptomyces sp. NBC_00237]MCX5207308.1 Pr6Pr family membrane protein [Streptomyces sp. NBC_00237]